MRIFYKFLPSLTILSIFLLDRFTKSWIQSGILLGNSISILPFFNLTYVRNTGIAFGMGQNKNNLFIFVSILLLLLLMAMLRNLENKREDQLKLKISLALVIGGAVGNLFDRIAYGSVIDFLDFYVGSIHWPSFNVADSSICVGVFILALSSWKKSPL